MSSNYEDDDDFVLDETEIKPKECLPSSKSSGRGVKHHRVTSSLIEIQDEVEEILKDSKVVSSSLQEGQTEENYENESFIREEDEPIRIVQSKKQSMVEVETRTSMKGATSIRASVASAKAAKPKDIMSLEDMASTINTEKNPPSEGIKVEIVKNAQISAQSTMVVQPRIRGSAPI